MSTIEFNISSNSTNSTSYVDPEPYGSRIFRLILFGVTIFCAVIGNTIICRVIATYPGKKTLIHQLIFNLALAEFVFCVCHAFVYHQHEVPYGWVLGSVMCKLLMPVQQACSIATTTILAEIAVYRYLVLRKAVLFRKRPCLSVWIILFTWTSATVLAIPAGIFHRVSDYQGTAYCMEVFSADQQHVQVTYSFVIFVANYVIPLALICISYTLVCVKVHEHIRVTRRLIRHQQQQYGYRGVSLSNTDEIKLSDIAAKPPDHATNGEEAPLEIPVTEVQHGDPAEAGDAGAPQGNRVTRPMKKRSRGEWAGQATLALENDLLRMIYAIICVYVICYLPYQVYFLLYQFEVVIDQHWKYNFMFGRYLYNIICMPSALHPFLYGTMSKFFRSLFSRW